jgi:response regulator RpfG family c-di-GMP phosphodiesterase
LLDDDQDILLLYRDSLQDLGYQTISFYNPDALYYLNTEDNITKCSLVITDYKMPQMSGIDFIKKIKEKSNTTLKFMLITAFLTSNLTWQVNLKNIKIDTILEKPIPLQLLKDEVQKLMKQ